jgi:hypothetical protein
MYNISHHKCTLGWKLGHTIVKFMDNRKEGIKFLQVMKLGKERNEKYAIYQ